MTSRELDVIGDVHGEADKLVALLHSLGYVSRNGAYRHSTRHAVFVGDLIDRGARQLEVIDLVRRMVDSGSASILMGNHEFNAIAMTVFDPSARDFHRSRTGVSGERHLRAHREFLDAVGLDSPRHREVIDWFRTFPLWLDEGDVRVVHACWHAPSLDVVRGAHGSDGAMTDDFVAAASTSGTREHRAIEVLLKGPEIGLAGFEYMDRGDHRRATARCRWWYPDRRSIRDLAMIPGHAVALDGGPLGAVPEVTPDQDDVIVYDGEVPVLFGHYWMTGRPAPLTTVAGCVDFSAAGGGPLVAYRWSGERTLEATHFHDSNDASRG